VLLATVATVSGLCAIPPRRFGRDARGVIVWTSLDALWLAPLALFIRENSAWTVAIAAVLVSSVVKLFHSVQDGPDLTDHPAESLAFLLRCNPFRVLESSPDSRKLLSAVGAALCAQTGVLAALAGYPFASAVLVGVSSAVWTWSFLKVTASSRRPYPTRSQSWGRPLLVVALAIILTAAGLLRYLQHSSGIRGFGMPSRDPARYAFSEGERRSQGDRERRSEILPAGTSEGDPGIVLWPEKLTHTRLVAPPPAIGDTLLRSHRIAEPLVIPFDGVYWFFKAPELHPPRTSRQAHGSPEKLDIRSTDRRPLSMEAHESLGSAIALDCCSRIQIAIRNADRYPETVSLELVLINTGVPGKPSQSLGRMMVKSTRPWKIYEERSPPVSETLNFVIPAKTSLRRFDAVNIIFRIDAARADAGPKIAIDHLLLIPRGL
jgi:hypothetical protein